LVQTFAPRQLDLLVRDGVLPTELLQSLAVGHHVGLLCLGFVKFRLDLLDLFWPLAVRPTP
jgi:hypothetical protein